MASVTAIPKKNNRCSVRYNNTLHGLQYLGNEEDDGGAGYVACIYSDPLECVEKGEVARLEQTLFESVVKLAEFGIQGNCSKKRQRLWFDDFLGKTYAAVTDRSDAPIVINALLSLGCSVQPWTAMTPCYKPSDGQFSIETSERLILQSLTRLMENRRSSRSTEVVSAVYRPYLVFDHRLWKTEEGKQFARSQVERHPYLTKELGLDTKLFIPFGINSGYCPSVDWPPLEDSDIVMESPYSNQRVFSSYLSGTDKFYRDDDDLAKSWSTEEEWKALPDVSLPKPPNSAPTTVLARPAPWQAALWAQIQVDPLDVKHQENEQDPLFVSTKTLVNAPSLVDTTGIQEAAMELDDDSLCVICLVNAANTMVLPCGHIVVCKSCSDELSGTLNEKRCVKCRDAITEVLADGP